MNILGRPWLIATGWKREYYVQNAAGREAYIDLAHPWLKLAIEADGEHWHNDPDSVRDDMLISLGWNVKHYRYPRLKAEPRQVKREVRRWFYYHLLLRLWM